MGSNRGRGRGGAARQGGRGPVASTQEEAFSLELSPHAFIWEKGSPAKLLGERLHLKMHVGFWEGVRCVGRLQGVCVRAPAFLSMEGLL